MKKEGIGFLLILWIVSHNCSFLPNGLSNFQVLKCLSSALDLDCEKSTNRFCCQFLKKRRIIDENTSRKFPHFPVLESKKSSPQRPVTDAIDPSFEDVPEYDDIITQDGLTDQAEDSNHVDDGEYDEDNEQFQDESAESTGPIVVGKRLEDNVVDVGNKSWEKKCLETNVNCSVYSSHPCCGRKHLQQTFRPTFSTASNLHITTTIAPEVLEDEMIQIKFCELVQTACSPTSKHPCCLRKLVYSQEGQKTKIGLDSLDSSLVDESEIVTNIERNSQNAKNEEDLCKADCTKSKENLCCNGEESKEPEEQSDDFSKTTKILDRKIPIVSLNRDHLISKGLCSSFMSNCNQFPNHPCCINEDKIILESSTISQTYELQKTKPSQSILSIMKKPTFQGGQRRGMNPEDKNNTEISEPDNGIPEASQKTNNDTNLKGYDRGMCAILKVPCRFVSDHPCCEYEMPIDLVARARSMDGSADLKWRKLKEGAPQARSFDSLFQNPTSKPKSQFFNKNIEYNHATSKSSVSIPRYYYDGGPETTSTILGVCWRLLYLRCPPPISPHENHLQAQLPLTEKIHPCCQLSQKPSIDSTGNSRISKWLSTSS